MSFLLDTAAFLWVITADPKLPPPVRDAIRGTDDDVWLSVVSFWEILVKHHLGRLPLPEPPASYIPRQWRRHRISPLALREEAVAHLPKLPALHRDPFDRMLVCQTIEHNLALVTGDPVVRSYPVRTFWV